jgi:F0F1-type ATP synthase epsilon subunit
MADLKIRVFKIGEAQPETTVTIPGGILKLTANLIPKQAADALRAKGIDLDEIIKLTSTPGFSGILVEVEDHKDSQKVVISVE